MVEVMHTDNLKYNLSDQDKLLTHNKAKKLKDRELILLGQEFKNNPPANTFKKP